MASSYTYHAITFVSVKSVNPVRTRKEGHDAISILFLSLWMISRSPAATAVQHSRSPLANRNSTLPSSSQPLSVARTAATSAKRSVCHSQNVPCYLRKVRCRLRSSLQATSSGGRRTPRFCVSTASRQRRTVVLRNTYASHSHSCKSRRKPVFADAINYRTQKTQRRDSMIKSFMEEEITITHGLMSVILSNPCFL